MVNNHPRFFAKSPADRFKRYVARNAINAISSAAITTFALIFMSDTPALGLGSALTLSADWPPYNNGSFPDSYTKSAALDSCKSTTPGNCKSVENLVSALLYYQERLYGDYDLRTLATMDDLAKTLRAQSRFVDAEALDLKQYSILLSQSSSQLSDDAMLRAANHLATDFELLGKSADAKTLNVSILQHRSPDRLPFKALDLSMALLGGINTLGLHAYGYSTPTTVAPFWPWPPLQPSSRGDITRLLHLGSTFGDISDELSVIADHAGYSSRYYFSVPHGFAMLTALEHIGSNGEKLPENQRWSIASETASWSWRDYLTKLFVGPDGRYRMFAFLVTPPFSGPIDDFARASDIERWIQTGRDAPDPWIAAQTIDPGTRVELYVYEFSLNKGRISMNPDHVKALEESTTDCLPFETHLKAFSF